MFTTTVVPAVEVHPLPSVVVKVYRPACVATTALVVTLGLCWLLLKLLGPVQEYVTMPSGPPVRLIALPTHTGPLLLAVAGVGVLTTTAVVAVFLQPNPLVTVNV